MARLDDGHPTTIQLDVLPGLLFYEKEVTPPGIDGGGENDTTTMLNTTYRTRAPKKLITLTPATVTAAYDPGIYAPTEIMAVINENTLVSIRFPDGQGISFFGWLDNVSFGAIVEGAQPTIDFTIREASA